MADTSEITIEGVTFVTSKRAAEETGYAQDYIGQLARSAQIQAKRVGGLWYVNLDSLASYKKTASEYKPQPPQALQNEAPEVLISFEGKDYLSAAKAAEMTGYHQDYVGQLAREGSVLARQVGNRWYVEKNALINHKKQKDALLAAVQSSSVGLLKRTDFAQHPESLTNSGYNGSGPFLKYTSDDRELLPILKQALPASESVSKIKIRKEQTLPDTGPEVSDQKKLTKNAHPARSRGMMPALITVGAIVLVVGIGFMTLKSSSIFVQSPAVGTGSPMAASVASFVDRIGAFLEKMVARELFYRR